VRGIASKLLAKTDHPGTELRGFMAETKKKGNLKGVALFVYSLLAAARGIGCPASGRRIAGLKIEAAIELKAVYQIVDFDRLGFIHKIFINNIFESVNFKCLVGIFWLIQSHGQTRPASSAFV